MALETSSRDASKYPRCLNPASDKICPSPQGPPIYYSFGIRYNIFGRPIFKYPFRKILCKSIVVVVVVVCTSGFLVYAFSAPPWNIKRLIIPYVVERFSMFLPFYFIFYITSKSVFHENVLVQISTNHSSSWKKRWALIGWEVYIFMPKSYTFRNFDVLQT